MKKSAIRRVVAFMVAAVVICSCCGCEMQDEQIEKVEESQFYLLSPEGELLAGFEYIDDFSENGLVRVRTPDTWLFGYVDTKGNWVIEPKFDACKSFAEGYAVATTNERDGWGIIDESGEWILEPMSATESGDIQEPWMIASSDRAVACNIPSIDALPRDELYGYIDFEGNAVTEIKYRDCYMFSDCGLAKVQDATTELYGYVNKEGDEVIALQYSEAEDFSAEGLAWVKDSSELWGVIDMTGQWVIEPKFTEVKEWYISEISAVKDPETNLWGYINAKGEWVIPPSFIEVSAFAEDKTAYADDPETGLRGIIDTTGDWIVEPQYGTDDFYYDGLDNAQMKDAETGLYGLIDETGKWAIEPKYTVFGAFSPEGIAVVSESSAEAFKDNRELYYFIDRNGTPLFDMKFDLVAGGFRSGVAIVYLPDAEREYE